MNTNGVTDKHWVRVFSRFLLDAMLFFAGFVAGMSIRFQHDSWSAFLMYWPGVMAGAVVFSVVAYIFGLYATRNLHEGQLRRSLFVLLALLIASGVMLGVFYFNSAVRIGRGAMFLGSLSSFVLLVIEHLFSLHYSRQTRERVAMIVGSHLDEHEILLNQRLWEKHLDFVGVVHLPGFRPFSDSPVLGSFEQILDIAERHKIQRIICSEECISDPNQYKLFCQLRYSGISVVPLIGLCEEVYQFVPSELVTTAWLLNASGSPRMLYIKKVKRGFDIVASLFGLILSSPILLFGVLLVRFTSRGPVFYRQVRSGRFGQQFEMLKLRTMRVDAEKHGAVWAQSKDPRVTPVGGFLRKYRIDEVPQLVNVLRGEMSLVGPRPERPEFVEQLAQQIPFYRERLMAQPGITGWAQVNYPYGSSVEDTRKKLEYDLYYMKYMSLFLDIFILLDTVRTILTGGMGDSTRKKAPSYASSRGAGRPAGLDVLPHTEPIVR